MITSPDQTDTMELIAPTNLSENGIAILIRSQLDEAPSCKCVLSESEVQDGAERILAFVNAIKLVSELDEQEIARLTDIFVRNVVNKVPIEDFRGFKSKTNEDLSALTARVSSAAKMMTHELHHQNQALDWYLDQVVPPNQVTGIRKHNPVTNEQEAARRVAAYVLEVLQLSDGGVEVSGEPSDYIPRRGWKVPIVVRENDHQEHTGEIMIFNDGEMVQKTRGELQKALGIGKNIEEG
ncbi:hypothetical protein KJ652_03195 [Patescibacteria group bacterium]|nr:hypothetical protein [Patescibacteria group bacterium]MBU1123573.1 hypothetical protein [Patescibacteria group bacterium]MBU1910925.1 hypothetical protein [Patescibacteria group bacterium]